MFRKIRHFSSSVLLAGDDWQKCHDKDYNKSIIWDKSHDKSTTCPSRSIEDSNNPYVLKLEAIS